MEILTYKFSDQKYLYTQLYENIKRDILSGKLKHKEKLPSKRKLSTHLNLSGTTIEIAYQQLLDEGYIYSVPKVGFFVEDIQTINIAPESKSDMPNHHHKQRQLSLKIEDSHIKSFPFHKFRKYARDAFEQEQYHLLELGDVQGEEILRNEIRRYLYHSRGVNCENYQIIIGSSTEQLFTLLTKILGNSSYILENPGYPLIRKVLQSEHKDYQYIDVDEEGLIVSSLPEDVEIVHVTPSHQFPTGVVLSAKRRTELINWSKQKQNRYIIEDDYDSEFRYKGRPLAALQGMSNDCVIYMSTFSKSIYPSIRCAYLVLPDKLLKLYKAMSKPNNTVPRHIQYMIAAFMKDGEFERNINRMRKEYKKKLELVLQSVKETFKQSNITGSDAGMHFVLETKEIINKDSIAINTIDDYYSGEKTSYKNKYIIGFGSIEDDEISSIIKRLKN
ncbi:MULTISPECIES: PLP-dependent aminotransferase family protein [Macrococcus]|uniref:PLP-dependent aminotransferase family protein n=1 Tax=Macrococcus psychrotolerans TaxID=3039389 RepID=A0AAT9P744_9STAP|nr:MULTISPECIES: PLP-dependent aminotransferase family protein [Macrococcus]MDJ1112141.1 PLP-dependent aminotransferase family protein [Macrococcus sp. S115]QYA32793.1 PLP-dependent aminotransferase family protein [Macrococcus sp. 19Msa1099]QYA37605.1 PLP-dependent aminotransferase family protein [Macrococcus caseolyticus]QYA76312.1 PLP-dependent aminotransferase family protein [Macrococcus caseolyticus]